MNNIVDHLRRRHFIVYECKTREEAVKKALEVIPAKSSVSWGGSMTIRDIGLTDAINKGDYIVLDRDLAKDPEEVKNIYHKALSCDWYLSSVNAITQDGLIVNIDGRGNRVAALTYGPENILFVVGKNKICETLDDAITRSREYAAPVNNQRFNNMNPCKTDQKCHNCNTPTSICNYIEIIRNSFPSGRHTIILVDEELGY